MEYSENQPKETYLRPFHPENSLHFISPWQFLTDKVDIGDLGAFSLHGLKGDWSYIGGDNRKGISIVNGKVIKDNPANLAKKGLWAIAADLDLKVVEPDVKIPKVKYKVLLADQKTVLEGIVYNTYASQNGKRFPTLAPAADELTADDKKQYVLYVEPDPLGISQLQFSFSI